MSSASHRAVILTQELQRHRRRRREHAGVRLGGRRRVVLHRGRGSPREVTGVQSPRVAKGRRRRPFACRAPARGTAPPARREMTGVAAERSQDGGARAAAGTTGPAAAAPPQVQRRLRRSSARADTSRSWRWRTRRRAPGAPPSCRTTCRPRCATRSSRPASGRCTVTSARPSICCAPARTSWSAPARRAASASATSSPCSTRTRATRRAARCSSSPPRRWPRTRRASCGRGSSGTAGARRGQARRPGHLRRRHADGHARPASAARPRSCSATPTCSTSASCPRTSAGRSSCTTCASSSSTRRTCTAACSAATWRRSCGACAACAPTTAPTPGSCSRRRPSPSRKRSPSGSSALPFTAVDEDQAPRPERTVVFWNPPLEDPAAGTRRSALAEASYVAAESVLAGARVIAFAPTRKAAELVYGHVRRRLEDRDPGGAAARVQPYRAGYTPQQRRDIERRLFAHELDAVVATQALELGIDVGSLDVSLVTGFPGTVTSLRQRWGRAGRTGHGWAVLVAGQDALDQYFMREPDRLLSRRRRGGDHRPAQPAHLGPHLEAAAYERPLTADDEAYFGEQGMLAAERLAQAGPPAAARRRPGLGLPALARRRDQPAHGGQRALRHRRDAHRRAHRHGGARARLPLRPSRRRVPAPGPQLPGARASTSKAAPCSSTTSTAPTTPRPRSTRTC